jgi:uncharacterized membrane protein YfcA
MNLLEFTLIVCAASLIAGFLGAMTGLGGGFMVVPFLTLVFGVDIRYAIGASLVSVIATSSGAAAAYVKEGFSNIRIGMFLEIATTLGALAGAHAAAVLPPRVIAVIFGLVLLTSAYQTLRRRREKAASGRPRGPSLADRLHLHGTFPAPEGPRAYQVRAVPAGFGLMSVAGILSGLLGIGSGALKVIAMDRVMRIPFKVSTTTSNFMIGVTAAASAGIYLHRGYLDPGLTMPVILGVLIGSLLGARVLVGAPSRVLRIIFAAIITLLAVEMIANGLSGRF